MKLRETKGMIRRKIRVDKKLFSFTICAILFFSSLAATIIIIPFNVKAVAKTPDNTIIYASKDSFLHLDQPDTNKGTLEHLYVDYKLLARDRAVVYFDLSSIPADAYIVSATLYLYYYDDPAFDPGGRILECWELDEDWGETTVTWNDPWGPGDEGGNYNETVGVIDTDQVPGSYPNWMDWDVTESVEAFYKDTRTNYGWLIADQTEAAGLSRAVAFRSRDYSSYKPKLDIDYILPPSAQTNAASSIEETTTTLNGEVTEDGGDDCTTGFYYSSTDTTPDGDDTNVTSTGTKTDGQSFSYSATSLTSGERYYVKAWISNAADFVEADEVVSFLTKPVSTLVASFAATAFNSTRIDLEWTNGVGSGADGAYIEFRTSAPIAVWNPNGEYGTKIDADGYVAGTSFSHTGRTPSTTYWYKAWAYASDGGWTSNGNSSAPFSDNPGTDSVTTAASTTGKWLEINQEHLHSFSGEGAGLAEALDGAAVWVDEGNEPPYWFIIDLGETYTIEEVRGRSFGEFDPTDVDIYVSDNLEDWGDAVETGIATWLNCEESAWSEIDTEDKDGRYIKVDIQATEREPNLHFGNELEEPFTIFDAKGYKALPTVWYYFDGYDEGREEWDIEPGLMVDKNEENYAGSGDGITPDVQLLNSNNCSGEDLGTISKVEIRAKGYWDDGGNDIILRPVFKGRDDGDDHLFDLPGSGVGSADWSSWYDITNDTNAPTPWSWDDMKTLCCDVEVGTSMSEFTVYCSQVEIQVSYTPAPSNNAPIAVIDTFGNINSSTTVVISANNSYDPDGNITNYRWSLGNGTVIEDGDSWVSVTYRFANEYTINLTVTDEEASNGYDEDTATVKHLITLVKNDNNNGVNYVTWCANASVNASTVASYLSLGTSDFIYKFNHSSANWSDIKYDVATGAVDFIINRWDHLLIHIADDRSYSFTPNSITSSQNVEMIFNASNKGYRYITWSNNFSITVANFATQLGASGDNIEINVYNPSTGQNQNYNPSLPVEFQTNFYIEPYDVICIKAQTSHSNITYNTDYFTE